MCVQQKTKLPNHHRHTGILALRFGLSKSMPLDDPKPVLVILGGPDHRLCYGSVRISMIALFSKLNLDMLVCMQMCPYQSWTNPAERRCLH